MVIYLSKLFFHIENKNIVFTVHLNMCLKKCQHLKEGEVREGVVTTEAEVSDTGPGAKECRQPPESRKVKETDFP